MDTLVIYDDLTSHAQAYREISLIAGVSPGRDSYPGDMFYTHSSLVERAGRLDSNGATQTILPLIYAPAGDITAYLPTNVMSMTDGQWILDTAIFKDTMRPAVSTGLSVTRVGGVGQNKRQKGLAAALNKTLAGYRQAEEYAHFGTELSPDAQANYDKGKALFKLMNQDIGEGYSLVDQQFLLDIVLNSTPEEKIDLKKLKLLVKDYASKLQEDNKTLDGNFDLLRDQLKAQVLLNAPADIKDKVDAANGAAAVAGKGDKTSKTDAAAPPTSAPGTPAADAKDAEAKKDAKAEPKADDKAKGGKDETKAAETIKQDAAKAPEAKPAEEPKPAEPPKAEAK
jgi:F0F1-type ATP synthase alpha subunit